MASSTGVTAHPTELSHRFDALTAAHMRAGGAGLGETAKAAVAKLATPADPESQTKATEFNKAGDHESGRNLMSDAG